MKANLLKISTLILLTASFLGCTESVPEKDTALQSKVVAPHKMLVAEMVGDQTKTVMTDQALLESLFREVYPYASDNVEFVKTPQKTYQPFQIEHDDMNAHGKRIYYLTALAEDKVVQQSMFLRLELSQEQNALFLNPGKGNILHIHTCSHEGKTDDQPCEFLYTAQGFYDGCTCGGDVMIFNGRGEDN